MRFRAAAFCTSLSVVAAACGGGSPTSPASTGSGSQRSSYRGQTVSALDGTPMSGVVVKLAGRNAVSDEVGRFEVAELPDGATMVTLSGATIVERQRSVDLPSNDALETLIPASFDLAAFDQMFRGTGQLQRWTSRPSLVVLASVMNYHGAGTEEYQATSEQLTDEEVALLIEHLTEGLALLTGNVFTSFAAVTVERPPSGATVNTLRSGVIVVGRYRGDDAGEAPRSTGGLFGLEAGVRGSARWGPPLICAP